jgi:acyl-CoA thioesterase YciA
MKTLTPFVEPLERGYKRAYRKLVMYGDLNAAGTIFGGTLVSWMDEASAISAGETMRTRRIVTKKISELVFNQPANLGDLIEIWCKTVREGTTSLTLSVIAVRRSSKNEHDEELSQVAEICASEFVFVSIDPDGHPRPWLKKA